MANPPVSSVFGNVCGNLPGGAGRSIVAGTFAGVLLAQPRSVVGIECISVKRGAQPPSSMPAGLLRPVDKPNEPAESNVWRRPEPLRSYTIAAPARMAVLPSPNREFSR